MSEENLNEQLNTQEKPDEMEGGFAVVDRERLIEEETRQVTPWYKFFIEAFTAPSKMIGECYGQEPYRGASYGVVGCMLFTALYSFLLLANPVYKSTLFETWRTLGTVAEENMQQTYTVTLISGTIGGIVGVFLSVLFSTIILQIIKVIAKDKATFSNLYKMMLIVQMVIAAVTAVDFAVAYVLGISGSVFQVGTLLGDVNQYPVLVQALCSLGSLSNVIGFIWLVIGYREVTHTTTKKAVIVAVIMQVFSFLITLGSLSLASMATGMAGM